MTGSECCLIFKSQFSLLEFALCGSFMKIFNTPSNDIVHYSRPMEMFNVLRKVLFLELSVTFLFCV